jgi:hypothetical protein
LKRWRRRHYQHDTGQALLAFADHGQVKGFADRWWRCGSDARRFTRAGIDEADAAQLQREGAAAFEKSWKDLSVIVRSVELK